MNVTTLRSLGIRLSTGGLYYSGALNLIQKKQQLRQLPQPVCGRAPFGILLYHRVNQDNDPLFPAVSVEAFDAQMKYLASNFRVRSLTEILGDIKRGVELEEGTLAITFDDGYRDNYLFAHPVLTKHNLPATLFVAAGFIGTGDLMWNDRLAWALKNTQSKSIVVQIGNREIVTSLINESDKLIALNMLLEQLKACPANEKTMFLESVIASLDNRVRVSKSIMLDWPEVIAMANQGWDIGSHTVCHQILTRVSTSQASDELQISKNMIEEKIQCPVTLCAYPNGKEVDFNAEIKAIANSLGYWGAATTVAGMNAYSQDPFELRRFSVWDTYLPNFACRLVWSYRRAYE